MNRNKAGPVFTFPVFGESGLGNKLIVWAKCAAWSRQNRALMLDPDWENAGSDDPTRRYRGLFAANAWIYKRLRTMAVAVLSPVEYEKGLKRSDLAGRGPVLVTFSGLGDAELISGENRYIYEKLLAKIHPAHRLRIHSDPFIGVHVRRGDFQEASEEDLRQGRANSRQPIEWYRAAIDALRSALGEEVPVKIFSDGQDQELEILLKQRNTARSEFTSPLLDLQLMAEAACLIGSRSTFTAAAAYLGQVPTLYFPGARAAAFSLLASDGQDFSLEPEWDYGDTFSDHFISKVRERLRHKAEDGAP